jgi:hypothetical protein
MLTDGETLIDLASMISEGKAIKAMAVLGLVALIVLAGCGGGNSSSSEPLTKAQFLKQANAICHSEEARKTKALESDSKRGKQFLAGSHHELEELVAKTILPLDAVLIEELAALNPPAKEAAAVGHLIDEYEAKLAEAEATPGKQIVEDSFFPVNKMAWKLGIEECTL